MRTRWLAWSWRAAVPWVARLDVPEISAPAIDQPGGYRAPRVPHVPGQRLVVSGRCPHARHFSITAYDPRTRAISSPHDARIRPGPGSTNPSSANAWRPPYRAWTVFVDLPQPGEQPSSAPDTFATGLVPGARVPATG